MKPVKYVLLYLLCMIPTYALPYAGSNSMFVATVSGVGAAAGIHHAGFGLLPAFIHLACLVLLCLFAWLRGKTVQKLWLIIFPVLAAVFDFAPFLSMIPFVPTVMHLCAIIVGVQPGKATETA